jgi:carbonic anhydrase
MAMNTKAKIIQESLTPKAALDILKKGNERFVNNLQAHRNILEQINETKKGQYPFATILSCIDSRTSAELIFDQGLGDVFSIRIAGNILNEDILGSMEYACKIAGSKLLVVLGHTNCGAIMGACNNITMGHITTLLDKIKPAIEKETLTVLNRNGENSEFTYNVTSINVSLIVDKIRETSPILVEMEKENEIKIVGGIYNVETGKVKFFD